MFLESLPGLVFLYFLSLFFIGVVFLIRGIKKDKKIYLTKETNNSWINFGFLIWSLFMVIFITQQIFSQSFSTLPFPWNKVALGFAIQFIILIFIILSVQYYPRLFNFPVNSKIFSLMHNINQGIISFLSAIPLVFIAAFSWNLIIKLWSHFGIIIPLQKQELVELFTQCNSKLVIGTIIFFAVIIAPITEEFIFRGSIYRFLKTKVNPLFALSVSALFFAWVHYNILSFLPLVLLGILLTCSYEKTGNIITPIVFHSLFNANTIILLLFNSNLNFITSVSDKIK